MSKIRRVLRKRDILFFIHIRKTGGMTLRRILDVRLGHKHTYPARLAEEFRTNFLPKEDRYRLFVGHLPYQTGSLFARKPVCMTILRNPIERSISHYFHFLRNKKLKIVDINVSDWVKYQNQKEYPTDNLMTRMLGCPESRIDELCRFSPSLDLAKERLEQFAFVGITDQFMRSLQLLAYTFAWPPEPGYTPYNVNHERGRLEDLSPGDQEMFYETNHLDSELYEFGQRLFEKRYRQMLKELSVENDMDRDPKVLHDNLSSALEENYEKHHLAFKTRTDSVDLTFDDAISGTGWLFTRAAPNRGEVRWSGSGTTSMLDFALTRDQDRRLRFCVVGFASKAIKMSLQLSVNGYSVKLKKYSAEQKPGTIYEARLDKSLFQTDKPFTRFTFHLSETVQRKSDVAERVGLAYKWLKIDLLDS